MDLFRVLHQVLRLRRLHLRAPQVLLRLLLVLHLLDLVRHALDLGLELVHGFLGKRARHELRAALGDGFDEFAVALLHEGHRRALLARARGPAHPVQVGRQRARRVEGNHRVDAGDVQPASGDVGGDQVRRLARAETLQSREAHGLRQVSVQLRGLQPAEAHDDLQPMRLLLRPGEHDDALRERSAHQRQQVRFFVRRRPRAEPQHLLGERPGGRADLVRGEPRGVLHGELREVLHAAGERRAEQQRLPPPRAVAHDLADLLQEPHLQKPVRLVQHQRREVLQPDAVRVPR